MLCPCKSKKEYTQCCHRFISGNELPETPEQLMRSRYTAYSLANIDYIVATMRETASEGFNKISAKQWAESVVWVKLKVMRGYIDPANADVGFVEFKAYYRHEKQTHVIHEFSKFKKLNQQWFYVGVK